MDKPETPVEQAVTGARDFHGRLPWWLSFHGVASRKQLVLGMMPVFILSFFLAQAELPLWASIPLGLPLVYVVATLLVKRLRDGGLHWGFVTLGFIPFIGWLVLAFMASTPPVGERGTRKSRSRSRFGTGLATFITVAVLGTALVPLPSDPVSLPEPSAAEQAPSLSEEEGSVGSGAGDGEPGAEANAELGGAGVDGDDGVEAEVPVVDTESDDSVSPPGDPSSTSAALEALLAQLRVEPEMQTGYDRGLFVHWIDADGDGCDTRREVLIAESLTPVSVGPGCSLTGGQWYSAFDGVTTSDPSEFDIDHFVPLKEAWDSGAHAWDEATRRQFANDLSYAGSLIAVSARSNRTKGASDPAEWLPPNVDYRCVYLATWLEVKIRWNLSADAREVSAIRSAGERC